MNTYSKIVITTLPLVFLLLLATVGITYHFSRTALTELAETWLDTRLSEAGSPMLDRVRREGGRILLTEVPPLNDPDGFHCRIDRQISSLTGNPSLEKKG